jgi:4-hydroxy 2-oxovalerate aldolase
MKSTKTLDCTLRDGGYYTLWDFDSELVDSYYDAMENLPIDYVEIGYRSQALPGYYGEFFYCPESVMQKAKAGMPSKKLAVLLDAKNIELNTLGDILKPCQPYITLIRIAVAPASFEKAVALAKAIKPMGFEIAFNVMYMSEWLKNPDFLNGLSEIEGLVDFFYMVDSYGGVTPSDVKELAQEVQSKASLNLAFHGHNNLELGLINTLTAIENGCQMVDSTITGMGRGAGNLKTELLLTYLAAKSDVDINFNKLATVVEKFEDLNKSHNWGTSLPYMVSGSQSLPQKQVMEWIAKNTYSIDSIVTALKSQTNTSDGNSYPTFSPTQKHTSCVVVGGGPSPIDHKDALVSYLNANPDTCVIHASSKNAYALEGISNSQYFCLIGNEGYRMSEVFNENLSQFGHTCVLPPSPREMGTFVPPALADKTQELSKISFTDKHHDSPLILALETALTIGCTEINLVGYDGYSKNVTKRELELAEQNEEALLALSKKGIMASSLVNTIYKNLEIKSVYSMLS